MLLCLCLYVYVSVCISNLVFGFAYLCVFCEKMIGFKSFKLVCVAIILSSNPSKNRKSLPTYLLKLTDSEAVIRSFFTFMLWYEVDKQLIRIMRNI